MDAQLSRVRVLAGFSVLLCFTATNGRVQAELFETPNFKVTADTAEIARQVAEAAEKQRRRLAEYWLGRAMPKWSRPCEISVNSGTMGAGGWTRFHFVDGEVLNWRMSVQGSVERILDSVIPHEVNHTVFASYFRQPLPRWADEGAATLFEHRSEQSKQWRLLHAQIVRDGDLHRLGTMLDLKEYPQDSQRMLLLYAQGYTLVDFLVQQRGPATFVQFLNDSIQQNWETALRTHYLHDGVNSLEQDWKNWFLAGMPRLDYERRAKLAAAGRQPGQSDPSADSDDQSTKEALQPVLASRPVTPPAWVSASLTSRHQPDGAEEPDSRTAGSLPATAVPKASAAKASGELTGPVQTGQLREQQGISAQHGGRQMSFVVTDNGPQRHWSIRAPALAQPQRQPFAANTGRNVSGRAETSAAGSAQLAKQRPQGNKPLNQPAETSQAGRVLKTSDRSRSVTTGSPGWFDGTGKAFTRPPNGSSNSRMPTPPGSMIGEPTGSREQFEKGQTPPAEWNLSQERAGKPTRTPDWAGFAGQQDFF